MTEDRATLDAVLLSQLQAAMSQAQERGHVRLAECIEAAALVARLGDGLSLAHLGVVLAGASLALDYARWNALGPLLAASRAIFFRLTAAPVQTLEAATLTEAIAALHRAAARIELLTSEKAELATENAELRARLGRAEARLAEREPTLPSATSPAATSWAPPSPAPSSRSPVPSSVRPS